MLFLIGLGLENKDIPVRSLEQIRKADIVLIERYTSFIPEAYVKYLSEAAGKEIKEIGRNELEEKANETVALAKSKDVAILFPGDPLIATTHKILFGVAMKQGIACKVMHATSIFSVAIGESRLDAYRFGPVVTVPFWSKGYEPTSFIEAVRKNRENKQHTLLLLDIDQQDKRPMELKEAIEVIRAAEKSRKSGAIGEDSRIIVLGDAGKEGQVVKRLKVREIDDKENKIFKGKALSIVVPSELSFAEEESLESLGN